MPTTNQRILEGLPWAEHVARAYLRRLPRRVDPDEIRAAALSGLWEAARTYSAEPGASWKTWARQRIAGSICDWLRRADWQSRRVRRFWKERAQWQDKLGTDSPEALAQAMGLSREVYSELARRADSFTIPMSQLVATDSRRAEPSPLSAIVDRKTPDPSEALARQDAFESRIRCLIPSRRVMMRLLYVEGLTMAETGRALGVSESYVSHVHGLCLGEIQAAMRSKAG